MDGKYSTLYEEVSDLSLSKKVRALSNQFLLIEKKIDESIEAQISSMMVDGVTTEDVFELGYLLSSKRNLKTAFVSDYELLGCFMDDAGTLAELNKIMDEIFESRESEDRLPDNY